MPSLYRQKYLAADHWRDFRTFFIQIEVPRRWSSARFLCPLYTNRIISPLILARFSYHPYTGRSTSPLIIGEIFVPSLHRQKYLATDHGRDFRALFIQIALSCHWSSARFSYLLYTDRSTSPLIIGEIFVPSLHRQKYLATDHWRDFRTFIIQTEVFSPLIIGDIFVPSLYRQNYLAPDHRRDFRALFIQLELPRRWSLAIFSYLLYTDRSTSPLLMGEIFVPCSCVQTELPRRWSWARFSCLLYVYRQNYLAADLWRDFRSVYKISKLLNIQIYRYNNFIYVLNHSHNMWICLYWLRWTDSTTSPIMTILKVLFKKIP